jgi:hypothetical protein
MQAKTGNGTVEDRLPPSNPTEGLDGGSLRLTNQ